jgi:TRAP transporter 4TM/12TM fusion protein
MDYMKKIAPGSEAEHERSVAEEDYEMQKRDLTGKLGKIVSIIAVLGALFHIYALVVSATSVITLRNVHLLLGFVLIPLIYPASKKYYSKVSIFDYVLITAGFTVFTYIALQDNSFFMRAGFNPTRGDLIVGTICILLVLTLAKRVIGIPLVIVTLVFVLYAKFAEYCPGIFLGKSFPIGQIISYSFSPDGILGITIGTSSTYVILFILFGAFLKNSGAGEFYTDFSYAIAGRSRGGPAKVAVVSSALFGTISGSGIANVVTTGTVTIPLMKKAGFSSVYAGAIEAVASTGGQIMPPVMGAGAFLMAEIIGVPYSSIMVSAALPALLYFVGIYFVIDLQAAKNDFVGLPLDKLPRLRLVLKEKGHLVIPLIVLIFTMLRGYTPIKAAGLSIISILLVSAIKPSTRMGLKKIYDSLENGVLSCMEVIAACACAGIIMALVTLTGIGIKMSTLIVTLSGSYLIIALLLTAVVVVIISMGLPTTACYIISSTVMAQALVRMGISPLQSHMFIFYYACLSGITPPVALTAYPAGAIAKADPVQVSITAFRIGIVGFLVPFMFIFSPNLFLQGNVQDVAIASVTSLFGAYVISISTEGWFREKLPIFVRITLFVAGILLIIPGIITDAVGIVIIGVTFITQKMFSLGSSAPEAKIQESSANEKRSEKD